MTMPRTHRVPWGYNGSSVQNAQYTPPAGGANPYQERARAIQQAMQAAPARNFSNRFANNNRPAPAPYNWRVPQQIQFGSNPENITTVGGHPGLGPQRGSDAWNSKQQFRQASRARREAFRGGQSQFADRHSFRNNEKALKDQWKQSSAGLDRGNAWTGGR